MLQLRLATAVGRQSARHAHRLCVALGCALIAAVATVSVPRAADAACVCRCSEGKPVAVCARASDIRPNCRATRCPLSTPKISPLDANKPRPPVKPGCTSRMVYDPKTGRHDWGQICE